MIGLTNSSFLGNVPMYISSTHRKATAAGGQFTSIGDPHECYRLHEGLGRAPACYCLHSAGEPTHGDRSLRFEIMTRD